MKEISKSKTLNGENNMDDFILEIKNNINRSQDSSDVAVKPTRFRELFSLILSSKPEIKIIDGCTPDGDIRFEVPLRTMGFLPDSMRKYRPELSTDFAANFMGEILVRENMDKFVKILVSLKDQYVPVVNKYDHRKFGMLISKDKCIFAFHSSLIQSILMEDIRKEMK